MEEACNTQKHIDECNMSKPNVKFSNSDDDIHFENEMTAVIHTYNVVEEDYFTGILKELKPFREFDEHSARMLCEKGDQLIKSWTTLGDAVFLYSKAIYMAPLESTWLAISHGNRAVALYKLNILETASHDCECALQFKHPEVQTIQLLQEKIAALQGKEIEPFSASSKQLEKTNLSAWTSGCGLSAGDNLRRESRTLIKRSQDRGRSCVANENIEVGETIISEESFTHYWQGKKHRMFEMDSSDGQGCLLCDNCLEDNIVPFPCYICRTVFYCSRECREKHDHIHRVECYGYKINFFGHYDEFHLSLRCLVTIFESILDTLTILQNGKTFETAADMWLKILEATKDGEFLSFFSDFQHFQLDGNVMHYSTEAALYVSYLETKTDFFEKTQQRRVALMKSIFEWRILMATLLLRIRSCLVYNEFRINCIIPKQRLDENNIAAGHLVMMLKEKAFGKAVYSRATIINHSCSPNASFRFKKTQIRIFATRRIVAGDEITIPYHSLDGCRENRNCFLYMTYGFLCNCAACEDIEEPHFKMKNGIVCNQGFCGAMFLPHQEACPRCGQIYSPAFYGHIETDAELIPASVDKFNYLHREYRAMERFLPVTSAKRQAVIKCILLQFLADNNIEAQLSETVSCLMLNLVLDLLLSIEVDQTKSSTSFALVMAYFMDILAIRNKYGMPPVTNSFNYSSIKQSVEFLPASTKAVFEKYFYCHLANFCV